MQRASGSCPASPAAAALLSPPTVESKVFGVFAQLSTLGRHPHWHPAIRGKQRIVGVEEPMRTVTLAWLTTLEMSTTPSREQGER